MAVSVDGVTPRADSIMPPKAPLAMPVQAFGVMPAQECTPPKKRAPDHAWRIAAFAPAVFMTVSLCVAIARWLSDGGVSVLEGVVVALVALTFIWVSLSVSTVLVGLVHRAWHRAPRPMHPRSGRQTVALLMPVYNEIPWEVFGNAAAMVQDLARGPQCDRFTLFILSDTQDRAIAAQELRAFWALRARCPDGIEVFYRRRAQNTDKKVGNLTDWIETWGGAFDAMVVLDADSLMSGAALRQLCDALAADPHAGLIQSFPSIIGAQTLFGRMQQFSNAVYGGLLAQGLAVWSQSEGNYWGHNAILRTRAFADTARLPHLRGRRGGDALILSHDFVEAAMLRRAGWAVRFLPNIGGSYEETPQTLIDYALRDRRWCIGNMQHLRLLGARGFHAVSRFHLLQGAVAFLLSPAWFALIVIWTLIGAATEQTLSYFNASNPLFPAWPTPQRIDGMVYLAFIYAMLLMPKLSGLITLALRPRIRADYGGWWIFAATGLVEIVLSVLYAPVLMVQQTLAVCAAGFGRTNVWAPQNRGNTGYTLRQILRFHWVETLIGTAMAAGIGFGFVSLWLVPIALSLAFAVPLSALSGVQVGAGRLAPFRLDSPHTLREPRIVARARAEREVMQQQVVQVRRDEPAIAAE